MTTPVGELPLTELVHIVDDPSVTGFGEQVSETDDLDTTVKSNLPEPCPLLASPEYEALITTGDVVELGV